MNDERLEMLIEHLTANLSELATQVADLVHAELESYREVSDEALILAVHRDMETAVRALRQHQANPQDDLAQVAQIIRERFQTGVLMEELVRAFAFAIWQIHQRFLEVCNEVEMSREEMLDGSNTLWRLGDAITTKVVMVYNELSLQQSLIDAQRRAGFVRRLLSGMVSAGELKDLAVDQDRRYAAVRCSCPAGFTVGDHQRIESTGSLPKAPAILALVDDECLGIVARPPAPSPGVLVAIGPEVPLNEVARSFEIADRICHVALHQGITGVCRLEDLTWRVAAVDQPEVAALLRRRFVDPLRAEGAFGADIEASVRSYLSHRLSIPRTAGDLNLHVNTLRYRLRRFTELTGADLDDPADLLDAVWAFELSELPQRTRRL